MSATEIAAAITRLWVQLYTIRMPADLHETRRAEIEADLWDHQSDAQENLTPTAVVAMEILLRTCLGVTDDLSWRFEAMRARRTGSGGRRRPMLELSLRQTRWMGLCGLIGGILWAADIIYFVRFDPTNGVRDYGAIALPLLLITGLLGFWAQQRADFGKVGTAGVVLLVTSLVALLAMNVLGYVSSIPPESLLMNLLGVAFALLLAPGFLLVGIRLTGAARVVPFMIAFVFLVWLFLPRLLAHSFPLVATWNRGDSPLGVAFFSLVAIGLALTGYSVFRRAAAGTTPHQ
ncbi:MAG TPA: hypothetical protein VMS98_03915 [Thermoanaerobaculia bacterium]|nr:hypothetical protein [Thermoanaerobaculia bacterium]